MTESLEVDEESEKFLPDRTIEWFEGSRFAGDDLTKEVVGILRHVRDNYGLKLDPEVRFALAAGYLHRALDCEAKVEGEVIEEWNEIPGDLNRIVAEILAGYSSEEKCREECGSVESRVAAANLKMAVSWATGEKAPIWTYQVVEEEFGFGIGLSKRSGALKAVEEKFAKS